MRLHDRLSPLIATIALCLLASAPARALDRSRPRNLAIADGGQVVLATSWGSNTMSQIRRDPVSGALGSPSPLAVGAKSWGVAVVTDSQDDVYAIVTHPHADYMTRLALVQVGGHWEFVVAGTIAAPRYCTEVIASPAPGHVLVAVAGQSASGSPGDDEAWRHKVIELDVGSGSITRTFVTEREPRALAMSPDGEKLFVGHVQGALGLITNGQTFNGHPNEVFDGGSILMFDYATASLQTRFPVGSPVLGLGVFPPRNAATLPDGFEDGHYLLYFTHSGDGALSEHPLAGGRSLPNVVSSIEFDAAHVAGNSARADVVFGHQSDLESGGSVQPNAAHDTYVVPERLCFAPDALAGWRIWVTFSGSGGVGTAALDASGRVATSGSNLNLSTITQQQLYVVTGRNAATAQIGGSHLVAAAFADSAPNMTWKFPYASGPQFVDVSSYQGVVQSSNPRGILYDPEADRVLVVTQFDSELVEIDPATHVTTATFLPPGSPSGNRDVIDAERNFFTRGRGFDFREAGTAAGASTQTDARVDNLTCASCHVDGHIDGKVRLSARPKVNVQFGNNPNPDGTVQIAITPDLKRKFKSIAVPSILDSGHTEWLFFEGIQTTFDAHGGAGAPACEYCGPVFAGIFTNTMEFALHESTPASPYAGTNMSAAQVRGREVFEEMNCVRCHAAPYREFLRSVELIGALPVNTPAGNTINGPLQNLASAQAHLTLHDPTQVFLQNGGGLQESRRNMTDVGTRITGDGSVAWGVNTPSLAGVWNNAPYMHDGRYATLRKVLENTWVDENGLSAPLLPFLEAFPDNFGNSRQFFDSYENTDTQALGGSLAQYNFRTHEHARTDATSVVDALSPYDADCLMAFLASLSSESDIDCPDAISISNFTSAVTLTDTVNSLGTVAFGWNTSYTAGCEIILHEPVSGLIDTLVTKAGRIHAVSVANVPICATYNASVRAISRVCGKSTPQETPFTASVPTPWMFAQGLTAQTNGSCTQTTLSWTTPDSVSSLLQWGVKNQQGYFANEVTTPAGYSHSAVVDVVNGGRYMARVVLPAPCGGVTPTKYWNASCPVGGGLLVQGSNVPVEATGITAVNPNPANPRTSVEFSLAREAHVSLRVYDLRGVLVATLIDADLAAGAHVADWNGRDRDGGRSASGVYFIRFSADGVSEVRRVALIK